MNARAQTVPLRANEVPTTSEQLSIFGGTLVPIARKDLSLDDRFDLFRRANPQVYFAFVQVAREYLRATGREHVGAKAVWERMRWEYAIHSRDNDFALDNSFVSRYARLASAAEPDLRTAFAFRTLRSRAA